jgi:osmotically-inducible protein OsmY
MSLHKLISSAVVVFSLSSTLAACATYEKCAGDTCTRDAHITTSVRTLLDRHSELGAPGSIEVQTQNRVVYLNGQVNDGLERGIAESVALQAPGVLKVVNSIAVAK